MSHVYFTADHHFSHANIIPYAYRPFASAEEMNGEMIRRWNETVSPEDAVYHLGDFALASAERIAEFLARLNGYKIELLIQAVRDLDKMEEEYREEELDIHSICTRSIVSRSSGPQRWVTCPCWRRRTVAESSPIVSGTSTPSSRLRSASRCHASSVCTYSSPTYRWRSSPNHRLVASREATEGIESKEYRRRT